MFFLLFQRAAAKNLGRHGSTDAVGLTKENAAFAQSERRRYERESGRTRRKEAEKLLWNALRFIVEL
jgi:hypothetical protein